MSNLRVAWTFDTQDAFRDSEMECNPIVVDGVVYATSPKLRVFALDAATGKQLWVFDPNEGQSVGRKQRNRGLTFWANASGNDGRIFASSRFYLYALNAKTGMPIPDFGDGGKIDLRTDLGRDPQQTSVQMTSPPVVFKDTLIVGSIVPETLPSSPGDVRAYDARTGRLKWSFHTIPHPGEFGYETWPKDAWKYIGGANNWSGMSLDERRHMVFVTTGSASFDFYGANRLGNNLFANCVIALNAETGERVWHFQTVHHDLWDRDIPAPPSLVTVMRSGQPIDAVAAITKSGWTFLFDRDSGEPLFSVKERPVPATHIDGEVTAKTQPFPQRPKPFTRQELKNKFLPDRTDEEHDYVRAKLKGLKNGGQFVPPTTQGTVLFPGFDGGGEWGGASFDPETHLLYVNANDVPWILRIVPEAPLERSMTGASLYAKECAGCHKADRSGTPPEFPSLIDIGSRLSPEEISDIVSHGAGRMPSFAALPGRARQAIIDYLVHRDSGAVELSDKDIAAPTDLKYRLDGYTKFQDKEGYPAVKPPWGTLNAINLDTGKFAWREPLGEYPALAAKGMSNTGSENYGGPVVTAGGLVFIGATIYDNKIRAFDKATGKLLWQYTLPFAATATPAIYEVEGKEYIAIACGGGKWGGRSGGVYVAFTIGDNAH